MPDEEGGLRVRLTGEELARLLAPVEGDSGRVALVVCRPWEWERIGGILRAAGFAPERASIWERALDHLRGRSERPALVVASQLALGHSEAVFLRRVRESSARPPIFLVLRPGAPPAADGYLGNPLSEEAVRELLRRYAIV